MTQESWAHKRAPQWTLEDFGELAQAEEGEYLEFKKPLEFIKQSKFSRDVFATEVTETLSAFLNSDGGVLLIGVQTDKLATDRKTESLKAVAEWKYDGTLEAQGITLSSSQIRDVIFTNLSPRPFGIEVGALEIEVEGHVTTVFVVTTPPSQIGAHQSLRTKVYYRRTADGDSPMADYEIRDVNSRKAGPFLTLKAYGVPKRAAPVKSAYIGEVSVVPAVQAGTTQKPTFSFFLLLTSQNLGRGTAQVARYDLAIRPDCRLRADSDEGWDRNPEQETFVGARATIFFLRDPSSAFADLCSHRVISKGIDEENVQWWTGIYRGDIGLGHPLWPSDGMPVSVGTFEVTLPKPANPEALYWVPWRVICEGMPEAKGVAFLVQTPSQIYIGNFPTDSASWWGEGEALAKFEELKEKFGTG